MGFESAENIPPTREMVVEALTNKGIDDPEVIAMLSKYAISQEQIGETLGGEFPHEEVAIHMAELYFDANYREYAIESLDEMEEWLVSNEDMYEELLEKLRTVRKRMLDEMK